MEVQYDKCQIHQPRELHSSPLQIASILTETNKEQFILPDLIEVPVKTEPCEESSSCRAKRKSDSCLISKDAETEFTNSKRVENIQNVEMEAQYGKQKELTSSPLQIQSILSYSNTEQFILPDVIEEVPLGTARCKKEISLEVEERLSCGTSTSFPITGEDLRSDSTCNDSENELANSKRKRINNIQHSTNAVSASSSRDLDFVYEHAQYDNSDSSNEQGYNHSESKTNEDITEGTEVQKMESHSSDDENQTSTDIKKTTTETMLHKLNDTKLFTKEIVFPNHLISKSGKQLHKCQFCEKAFTRKATLNRHIGIHTDDRPFKCDQCEKSFLQKRNLTDHLLKHIGFKPYVCDQCNKAFTRKCEFTTHLNIHSRVKLHKCELCDKVFTRNSNLATHLRTHTREKPFICDQCGKAFSLKYLLVNHLRRHAGIKPFKCNQCERAFERKIDLEAHLTTHSGEKRFKCQLCDKSFTKKDILLGHVRSHTGERPFECVHCGKTFGRNSCLYVHLKIHSKVKS